MKEQQFVMRATLSFITYVDDGSIVLMFQSNGQNGMAKEIMEKNGIKAGSKVVVKGTGKDIFKPSSSTGAGDHLRRTYDVEGSNVRINSGHGYNRSHRTGSVQGIGTMDQIESSILADVQSLIKSRTSLPTKNTLQRTVIVNGNNVGYDVMKLKDGTISISTYYPK